MYAVLQVFFVKANNEVPYRRVVAVAMSYILASEFFALFALRILIFLVYGRRQSQLSKIDIVTL